MPETSVPNRPSTRRCPRSRTANLPDIGPGTSVCGARTNNPFSVTDDSPLLTGQVKEIPLRRAPQKSAGVFFAAAAGVPGSKRSPEAEKNRGAGKNKTGPINKAYRTYRSYRSYFPYRLFRGVGLRKAAAVLAVCWAASYFARARMTTPSRISARAQAFFFTWTSRKYHAPAVNETMQLHRRTSETREMRMSGRFRA